MIEAFFQESTPVTGRRHPALDGATIGRGDADVVLVDPQVSRVHARLRVDASGIHINDLGSRNGTFVNEVRIEAETALSEGDTVRMGDTVWRLFTEPPAHPGADATRGSAPASEPSEAGGRRGDVPAPEPMPSGVRSVPSFAAPAQQPEDPPSFSGPRTPQARRPRGSAARNTTATILAYAVVLATAVAVVLYLALR